MEEDSPCERDWDVDGSGIDANMEGMDEFYEAAANEEFNAGIVMTQSPGKTKYWTPHYDESNHPRIGMCFKTPEEGIDFYKTYAKEVGFDIRLSSSRICSKDGTLLHRRILCSRAGFKGNIPTTGKRHRVSNRVGCKAIFAIKYAGNDGYIVSKFEAQHNHSLLEGVSKKFMKTNRKLDYGHQKFLINCAKANLGPAMSHRLMNEIMGGCGDVGPIVKDCRNFKRDLMAYISGADAQMILDTFHKKQERCSGFYFAYDVDEQKRLTRLFWCDPIARSNFAAFGDVVSFDSTYRSNKYSMVFAPFTGMDNHRKSVTFGAGLLLKEDVDSYKWILRHFKEAMFRDPAVIVTDQDPALRIAVPDVFPDTRHRFCMWHIMMKLPLHVDKVVLLNKDFRLKINKVVWSYETTVTEFEQQWGEMIDEFDLGANTWLSLMYSLRQLWIPAYFRDVLLGGLMRTTSISESANSFFGRYNKRNFTLIELMMQFDSAMDAQRHAQSKLDMESATMTPNYKTPHEIERFASSVYTLKTFLKVQYEIYFACVNCNVTEETVVDGYKTHVVRDEGFGLFTVQHDSDVRKSTCTCNMFNRVGIPCLHIFCTYKYMYMKEIPNEMVLPRWRKDARRVASTNIDQVVVQQCIALEEKKELTNKVWSAIYSTVGSAVDDTAMLEDLLQTLNAKRAEYMKSDDVLLTVNPSKQDMVESFVGIKVPPDVTIQPPVKAKNKGTRIKSSLETATTKANKPLRKCARCGQLTTHDKRNCKESLE